MNTATPHSHQWKRGGSFVSKVEPILMAGRSAHIKNPSQWHTEASDAAYQVDPEETLLSASKLVEEAPYGDLQDALEQVGSGNLEALNTLRMGRKLFLIARDGIILTTHQHATEEFRSLRTLCMSLGRINDSRGTDGKHHARATESLQMLEAAPSRAADFLHDSDIFRQKVAMKLSTHVLIGTSAQCESVSTVDAISSEAYHQARKDFRRVSNMYVLKAAASGEESDLAFAAQGVRLNRHYGDIADQIDALAN